MINIFDYIRVALIDKKSDIKQLNKDVVGWLKLISLIMFMESKELKNTNFTEYKTLIVVGKTKEKIKKSWFTLF